MPLQQISLDQSIYKKKDTNINRQQPSQKSSANGSPRTGHLTAAGATEDSFTERQKALWAEQDKKQKEEREASMQQAQEIGMRVKDGLMKEQVSAQQQAGQQQQQQAKVAQEEKIKEDMPQTALEMHKFISTLDEEGQKFYIDHIKQKEYGNDIASTISLTNDPYDPENDQIIEDKQNRTMFAVDKNGKKKMVIIQGSGGGMYAEMVKQGLLNPSNDTIIKRKQEGELNRFKETESGRVLDTMTGKYVSDNNDLPKGISLSLDEIDAGYKYGSAHMGRLMSPSNLEKVLPEGMANYIKASSASAKAETEVYFTGLLQGKGMKKDDAKREAKRIAYNMSYEEAEAAVPTTDEDTVGNLKTLFKENPDAIKNRKAYEDKYGKEAVAKALEENESEKVILPPKVEIIPKVETVEKKKVEKKPKSAFKSQSRDAFWSPL